MIKTQKLSVSKKNLKTVTENSPKKQASSPQKQNALDYRRQYSHRNKLEDIKKGQSGNVKQFVQRNDNLRKAKSKYELKLNFNKTCIVEATQQSDPDQSNTLQGELSSRYLDGQNNSYRKQKQEEQKQRKPLSSRSVGKLRRQTPSPIKIQQQPHISPLQRLKLPQTSRLLQPDITPSQTSRTTNKNLNLSTQIQYSKNRTASKAARYSYVNQNNNSAQVDQDRIQNYTNRKEREVQYRIKSQHINNMHREIQSMLQIVRNKGKICPQDENRIDKKESTNKYQYYDQISKEKQRDIIHKGNQSERNNDSKFKFRDLQKQQIQQYKPRIEQQRKEYQDISSKKYDYSENFTKISEFKIEPDARNQIRDQNKRFKLKLQQIPEENLMQKRKENNKYIFEKPTKIKYEGSTKVSNNLLDTSSALDKQIYEDYLQKYNKMVTSYSSKEIVAQIQQKSVQKSKQKLQQKLSSSPYLKNRPYHYPVAKPKQFADRIEPSVPTSYQYTKQSEKCLQQSILSRRKYKNDKHAPRYEQKSIREQENNRHQISQLQLGSHLISIEYEAKGGNRNGQNNQETQQNYDQYNEEDSSYIDLIDKEITKIKDRIMTSQQVTRQMEDKYLLATLKNKDKNSKVQTSRSSREDEKKHTARFTPISEIQQTIAPLTLRSNQIKNMDTQRKYLKQAQNRSKLLNKQLSKATDQHSMKELEYTQSRVQNIQKYRQSIQKYRENIVNRQLIQEEQRVNIQHEIIRRKVAAYFGKQVQLYASMRPYRQAISNKHSDKQWQQLSDELERLGYTYKPNELKQLLELSSTETNPFSTPTSISSHTNMMQQFAALFIQSEMHWDTKIESCLNSEHYEQIITQYYFSAQDIDLNKKGYIAIQDLVCFVNLYDQKFYRNRDFVMFINKFHSRTNQTNKKGIEKGRIQYWEMQDLLFRPINPRT